ncbi:hypothetical protein [uncultured Massilia sp.]|uniref:hypothetical protein n=1 Tax=uncultured Massilia sp. TaxID=169973 RepID=UPI0025FFA624|nr:hypothetical protein [uncultured Massilia sp.]
MHTTIEAPSLAPQNTAVPRRPGLRSALLRTRAVLQWRLLLWWAILLLLPAIVATLPFWQMLAANLDHSVHAARLAERLDMLAIADLVTSMRERGDAGAGLANGGLVAVALTLLLSPLLSGMTIAAVRAPQRLRCIPLLAAGAQEYGRLLRMLAWAVVPLGIAGAVGGMASGAAGRVAERAILQGDAEQATRLALVATVVLLALAHASLDAGRAILGNEPRRRSAVLAWWAGTRLLLRRPLAVLGVYMIVTGIGLAVAALLALARLHVPALGAAGTVGAVVLAELAVLALGVMRAARLAGMMELARRE